MKERMLWAFYLAIMLVLCQEICFASKLSIDEEKSHKKFVPTSEWQKVDKGQPLPAGLHYRINVYTGESEAKLLDTQEQSSDASKTSLQAVANEEISSNSDEALYMSKEELRKVLAEVNAEGEDQETFLNKEREEVKEKYRSYEDLKKEFGSLNLTVKTDMEILKELVLKGRKQVTSNNEEEDTVTTLKDLEYMVHQIDNGKEFIRLGGLENIIIPALNATSPKVRAESLRLVGSAAQSNPKVQIAILNAGFMQKLVKAAVLDSDTTVHARAIYALSCLTRQFPAAQAKLIKEGGLATLSEIIDNGHSSDFKTKMRVITLISDLMLERKFVRKALDEYREFVISDENDIAEKVHKHKRGELKEKLRQYDSVNLEKRLVESGWCLKLPEFLYKLYGSGTNAGRTQRRDDLGSVVSKDVPYRPEHDAVEKVTGALLVLKDICLEEFRQIPELEEVLHELLMWYQDLSIREEMLQKHEREDNSEILNNHEDSLREINENDLYYTSIAEILKELLKWLRRNNLSAKIEKDEL